MSGAISPAYAHELGIDQVLITNGQTRSIEMQNLRIELEASAQSDSLTMKLEAKDPAQTQTHEIAQPIPGTAQIAAVNRARYCAKPVLFVTLSYPPPPLADIKSSIFETHAISLKNLALIGTVPAGFDAIAPYPKDADLGIDYEQPQGFTVTCTEAAEQMQLLPVD